MDSFWVFLALCNAQVVHGDIKLDNILITKDLKTVSICDFGTAGQYLFATARYIYVYIHIHTCMHTYIQKHKVLCFSLLLRVAEPGFTKQSKSSGWRIRFSWSCRLLHCQELTDFLSLLMEWRVQIGRTNAP
jgi:serine/threonine protein kinase